MVANGQLEVPIGTVLLEFEVADFILRENLIIMKNLPTHWTLLPSQKQCRL